MPSPLPSDDAPPVDPDLVRAASTRATLAVIAGGGVLGALARYQVGRVWPVPPAGFPWSTALVNVSGCLLIGMLYGLLPRRPGAHPLWRPFLGTGVLGGYTTFSTYAVDLHRLLDAGRPATAAAYLVGTLAAALAATTAGLALARRAVRR